VIDQVNAKLMHWKANQLSFAGRVTLAKSVLEAIPIYPMMTNMIPKACIDEIHRIQRSFIWGDTDQARRYHAVGWEMVTRPKNLGGLGLRKLSTMNKACILKLGRKIQAGAKDFVCEVLVGKYMRTSANGEMMAKATDSHLWKSIVKLWPHLDDYSWWTIGDGNTIKLCQDAWIENGLRLENCNLPIPEQLRHVKLIDVADGTRWNWNMLDSWIPPNMKAKIAALLPPDSSNGADKQVCMDNAMGLFSISKMYHALCDFNLTVMDPAWHHIWRLKVPERVRAFIWIVKHGRLLTNERKHRMGLGSATCDYCRDCNETTLHVLRDCQLIRPLWICLVDINLRHQFFNCDTNDWIAMNVANRGSKSSHDDWSCVWAMACHLAWTWRNKEKHDDSFVRPIKQVEAVKHRIINYGLADKIMQHDIHEQRAIIQIGWSPPISGWVCLNVDGALREGVIGCGGAIRGSDGEWINGFSKLIGRGDVYVAELWGVLEGIGMARRMNFSKV
jgi:hypothetical protein